jgi:predicted dithiol-disulfide oxidoreductase (DUF899 family)
MAAVHTTGSTEEHLAARLELLAVEKELTRRGDEVASMRRALPWVAVEKEYIFDTDEREKTLRELFDGRSQLLLYHFMFGPEWSEGCPVCSYLGRQLRRRYRSPAAPRRHDDLRLPRTDRTPPGIQGSHGLELPVGVLGAK